MTNTWTPAFQATLASIFDAAESDLRALGFGEIERRDSGIGIYDRNHRSISIECAAILVEKAIVVWLRVQVTAPAVVTTTRIDTDMRDELAQARRNLAIVELADRWVQRWGHMQWGVDEAMGPGAGR